MIEEYSIVRPKAWSMRTEFRAGSEVLADLSGAKSFGRKATATVGDKTYILSTGGKKVLISRMRESGKMEDVVVMEHTAAAKGVMTMGGSVYELSRSPDGQWTIVSAERGPLLTFVCDPKDPSQGRIVIDLPDDNALLLALLGWFSLRAMEY